MIRKNKQKRLPLDDDMLTSSQSEVIEDLKKRIDNLTGPITENVEGDIVEYSTRDMVFVRIYPEEDYVVVQCNLPYDRILDMSCKCQVHAYAASDNTDIVSYKVKTKFDVQYAVSIVQQSFIYRKRLKL